MKSTQKKIQVVSQLIERIKVNPVYFPSELVRDSCTTSAPCMGIQILRLGVPLRLMMIMFPLNGDIVALAAMICWIYRICRTYRIWLTEGGLSGQTGVSACMERFRGIEAATILHLYLGLLVRENISRKRTVLMEGGAPGLLGMSAACMGRFRGRGAATILHLYLGLLVREKTNMKKAVAILSYSDVREQEGKCCT